MNLPWTSSYRWGWICYQFSIYKITRKAAHPSVINSALFTKTQGFTQRCQWAAANQPMMASEIDYRPITRTCFVTRATASRHHSFDTIPTINHHRNHVKELPVLVTCNCKTRCKPPCKCLSYKQPCMSLSVCADAKVTACIPTLCEKVLTMTLKQGTRSIWTKKTSFEQ